MRSAIPSFDFPLWKKKQQTLHFYQQKKSSVLKGFVSKLSCDTGSVYSTHEPLISGCFFFRFFGIVEDPLPSHPRHGTPPPPDPRGGRSIYRPKDRLTFQGHFKVVFGALCVCVPLLKRKSARAMKNGRATQVQKQREFADTRVMMACGKLQLSALLHCTKHFPGIEKYGRVRKYPTTWIPDSLCCNFVTKVLENAQSQKRNPI